MIRVVGIDRGGVSYQVVAGTSPTELARQGQVYPASYGETVHGTARIIAALAASDGEPVLSTPTGPVVSLSSDDPNSVRAWLARNTEVITAVNDAVPASMDSLGDAGGRQEVY
jgi:hypothetical protein